MSRRLVFALLAATVSLLQPGIAAGAAEPYYTVVDLGPVYPTSLASNGYITGKSYVPAGAFLWSPSGQRTILPPLPGTFAFATAVNKDGDVAGHSRFATSNHATLWRGGQAIDLGTLGGSDSYATGINNLGVAVGYWNPFPVRTNPCAPRGRPGWGRPDPGGLDCEGDPIPSPSRAFLSVDGAVLDIGSFEGLPTVAHDINNRNEFVGYAGGGVNSLRRGFLVTRTVGPFGAYVFVSLGTFGSHTSAYALNDQTQVVGASSGRPFLWQKGALVDLGTLLTPGLGHAADINNVGQIVGSSTNGVPSDNLGGLSAVLWQNGAIVDLNTQIMPGTGWSLDSANGINDAGRILGYGRVYGGPYRGFLLVPLVRLKSFSLSPSPVLGGKPVTGQVTLDRPAPPGGATVAITHTFATTPAPAVLPQVVVVPAGTSTRYFPVPTSRLRRPQTGTVTARYNGTSKTVTLTVRAAG